MKPWFCAALVLAGLSLPLAAQAEEAAPNTSAARPQGTEISPKQEKIQTLLRLTGAARMASQMLETMLPRLKDLASGMGDKEWKALETELKQEFSEARVIDKFGPIYDKHFSEAELAELIAFYQSPIGQKYIAELPALTREGMAIGEQMGREAAERVFTQLTQPKGAKPSNKGAKPR